MVNFDFIGTLSELSCEFIWLQTGQVDDYVKTSPSDHLFSLIIWQLQLTNNIQTKS